MNYRSHALDSGLDPDTVPPIFFRKASHSLTAPTGDIIRPPGVGFLDYEVELGLVIGADLPVGTTVTDASLARYVAALVVTNDVSARQIQLTKTQFYEAKSYPTFTPAGPWLTLVDAADLAALDSLRLTLAVNGQIRQDSTVADMIVRTGARAHPAGPVPAPGTRRPAADRNARRDRAQGAPEGRREARRRCCRPPPSGSCSSPGRPAIPATCVTATSSPRGSPPPTGSLTSAPSTTP